MFEGFHTEIPLIFLYFYRFRFFYTLKTLILCGFSEVTMKIAPETTDRGNPILYRN